MKKRKRWDLRAGELDYLCKRSTLKINALEERLKELIEGHREEIRERYEAIEGMRRKYPDFQELLNSLVNEFYEFYIRRKENQDVKGLPWHHLDDLFNRIKEELGHELEEIDDIRRRRDDAIESLKSLLREVHNHLRKEYKLTPSEQSLQILSDNGFS
jgi:hypothetical protein